MDTPQPTAPEAIDAYLRRIGATRPERPDAAALRELQHRHLLSVPFENLAVHLGEEIVLADEPLLAKVVEAHRGGFCYELNGSFAVLLRGLGFGVTLLQARTFGKDGRLGIPYGHLTLRVETEDGTGPWFADVGFGEHSQYPLMMEERGDQLDPAGTFRIVGAPAGDLDVLRDGKPQFRVEARPRVLADFEAGAWYHRTSPASHFTQSLVCSRLTGNGRITLTGRKLVTTVHGVREERQLGDDAEVLAAYRDHFGVELRQVPQARRPDSG
ncbi:arylamine N-acetyltransferase [Streptomyces sp. NPDC019396]|uniref:arylamine N-acetyltransferase family protein n=1 Tax=Streptomyces sp. NPDC019396 TaxID=3154687 RepID=UPI0033CC690D